jgi:hypothetical protein
VVDPLVPDQVSGFFETAGEREREEEVYFQRLGKSLCRRRFRDTEDAPFAAY